MSLKIINFRSSGLIIIRILLLSTLITGCGSFAPTVEPLALIEVQDKPVFRVDSTIDNEFKKPRDTAQPVELSRPMATALSGAVLLSESVIVDPIVRPVSTINALASLTFKSLGGFLNRNTINLARFPLMEKQPIPALSNTPAMDLEVWEQDLDVIVGTQSSLGTIQFLVDGSEYFPRLIETFANAEKSIDMRTYIYDNDDVGVQIADILKKKSAQVDVRILVDGLGDLFATSFDSETMPVDFELPGSITSYLEKESSIHSGFRCLDRVIRVCTGALDSLSRRVHLGRGALR